MAIPRTVAIVGLYAVLYMMLSDTATVHALGPFIHTFFTEVAHILAGLTNQDDPIATFTEVSVVVLLATIGFGTVLAPFMVALNEPVYKFLYAPVDRTVVKMGRDPSPLFYE